MASSLGLAGEISKLNYKPVYPNTTSDHPKSHSPYDLILNTHYLSLPHKWQFKSSLYREIMLSLFGGSKD